MKRPIQLPGQRDWAGDDLIDLNSESLKAIEAVIAPYPMCVLSGCEVTASGAKYNISPGYVVLRGVGHDGRNVNRIVPFAGINNTILPLYLTLSYTTISDVYGDGKSKAIAQDYKAVAATVKPGGDHLAITATGTVKLVDAIQDGGHRFITDSERTTWNGKETPTGAQAKANAALASAKSYAEDQSAAVDAKLATHNTDSTRHITADERASWKAKETTTGAQSKADAALASANTYAEDRAKTVDGKLESHKQDSAGHLSPDERAAWNAKETPSGAQAKADVALASAKTYADNSIDDIHIGVENLINNSKPAIPWTGNSAKYQITNWLQDSDYIIEGQTYTIVAELYVDAAVSGNGIGFWVNGDRQCGDQFFKPLTPTVVVTTFVARISGYLCAFHVPQGSPGNSYINWVKLVKGDKASLDHSYSVAYDHAPLGGVNLLRNTELINISNVTSLTNSLEIGQTYTLSIGKSTSTTGDNTKMLLFNHDNVGDADLRYMYYLDIGTNQHITFTAKQNNLSLYAGSLWNPSHTTKIERLKLEKGNRASDWLPSISDVQFQIDHINRTTQKLAFGNVLDDEEKVGEIWTKLIGDGSPEVYTRSYKGYLGGVSVGVALNNVAKEFTVERAWALSKQGYVHCAGDGWVVKRRSDGQIIAMATDANFVGQIYRITLKYLK